MPFNIIPTALQNVQLQVKLLPRMQEKAPFSTIFEIFLGACPHTPSGVRDCVARGSTTFKKVGMYVIITYSSIAQIYSYFRTCSVRSIQ